MTLRCSLRRLLMRLALFGLVAGARPVHAQIRLPNLPPVIIPTGVSPPSLPSGPPIHQGPPITFQHPDPCVKSPAVSPAKLVAGGETYGMSATVCNVGTSTATGLKLTAAAVSGGVTFWSSQMPIADLAAGGTVLSTLPARLPVPLSATHVDVTFTVTADADVNPANNVAKLSLDVAPLPANLNWAGFIVRVQHYTADSSLAALAGQGTLALPGVSGATLSVSFSGAVTDATGRVSGGPELVADASPPVFTSGANGTELSVTELRVPPSGPGVVTGALRLPPSAGIDAIDGGDTLALADAVLGADGVLRGLHVSSLELRDLPTQIALDPRPLDLSMSAATLCTFTGSAAPDFAWPFITPAGTPAAANASFSFNNMGVDNSGRLTMSNTESPEATPQKLAYWGVLTTASGVGFDKDPATPADGDRTHYLVLNGRLHPLKDGQPPDYYLNQDVSLDGLWFGANGVPDAAKVVTAHAPADAALMGFPYHPSQARLTQPGESPPSTQANVLPTPTANIGYLVLPGVVHLTFFGDVPTTFWIGSNADFVAPDKPLSVSRDLFDALTISGDMLFTQPAVMGGMNVPAQFAMKANPNLLFPQAIIQTDEHARVTSAGDARLFIGAEAGPAIQDIVTAQSAISMAPGIAQEVRDKLGAPGAASDAAKFAQKVDSTLGTGWATGAVGGAQSFFDSAYSSYQTSGASDLFSLLQSGSQFVTQMGDHVPVQLKLLRGDIGIHDDSWEDLNLEAGATIPHFVQDASLKFSANRHNEYRLDLKADKITVPFLSGGGDKPTDGQTIGGGYLRLLVNLSSHPRLDGAFGLGEFTPLALIAPLPAGVSVDSLKKNLDILHVDGQFGIGVTMSGDPIAYVGAAVGLPMA